MFFFYHQTKLGNSFNIVLAQEILWQEYGISSAYPQSANFWNLFEAQCRPVAGYIGGASLNAEINAIKAPIESLFAKSLVRYPVDVSEIHKRCVETGPGGYSRHDGTDVTVLSADRSGTIISGADLRKDRFTVLNRGHNFVLENASAMKMVYQDSLRDRLEFDSKHVKAQTGAFHAFRSKFEHVIAVHLRKTDYATYRGGEFYYSDEQYAAICRVLAKCRGGDAGFIIFSDDEVDMNHFDGLHIIRNSGSAEEDIVAMSMCDCIVGPPSSFANCASFIGKTRRIIVRDFEQFRHRYADRAAYDAGKWFPMVG